MIFPRCCSSYGLLFFCQQLSSWVSGSHSEGSDDSCSLLWITRSVCLHKWCNTQNNPEGRRDPLTLSLSLGLSDEINLLIQFFLCFWHPLCCVQYSLHLRSNPHITGNAWLHLSPHTRWVMMVSTSACKLPEHSWFLPHLVKYHIDFLPCCARVLISYFMLVYRCLCDAQTVLSVPLINSDFL